MERTSDPGFTCPKCRSYHGNDWSQCDGACPMTISPHYDRRYDPEVDPGARRRIALDKVGDRREIAKASTNEIPF